MREIDVYDECEYGLLKEWWEDHDEEEEGSLDEISDARVDEIASMAMEDERFTKILREHREWERDEYDRDAWECDEFDREWGDGCYR